ncbi:MAG: tRNA pseudouridine(55) synthase TruB [Ruminococcaceae bacterium]|nr:tRNA pseudouridine(55) synthase TruB [Oscillospiraceae bacterium]
MGVKHTEIDNLPGGIIAVNKPSGISSHDVVNKIRRLYNAKRVGHAGTLDPLAEGVLVVLVGRAAKACEYISSDKKAYTATLRLGLTTDTEDITGELLSKHDGRLPTFDEVAKVCEGFCGKIMQTPPMYSALKVNGQKLYDLARQGVVIDRQAREIEVFSISCRPTDMESDYIISVECSGGTYIRTLCADIGSALGCGGVMASLRRDEACGISLNETYALNEIEEMSEERRQAILIPTERLFDDLASVRLPEFFEKLFRSGCPVYQSKIKTSILSGRAVKVYGSDGEFFALGRACEHDGESVIKSIKIFKL